MDLRKESCAASGMNGAYGWIVVDSGAMVGNAWDLGGGRGLGKTLHDLCASIDRPEGSSSRLG